MRFLSYSVLLQILFLLSNTSIAQWRELHNHFSADFNSIYSNKPESFISVGDSRIFRYKYEQEYWKIEAAFDSSIILNSVYFIDKNRGFVTGNNSLTGDGVLSITTNGGYDWSDLSLIMNNFKTHSMKFLDENTGWVAGMNIIDNTPLLMYTTNGGLTWSGINFSSTENSEFTSLFFIDSNFGWAAGKNIINASPILYKTTDAGSSWLPVNTNVTGKINDIYFISKLSGYICTDNGEILVSTNGGENWNTVYSTNTSINAVRFSNMKIGIAVGDDGLILTTADGGQNWSAEESRTSRNLLAISPDIKNTVSVCGENGKVLVREYFSEKCNLIPVAGSTIAGDYDNDGDLDIALTGFTGVSGLIDEKYTDIFKNDGNNTFTSIQAKMIEVLDGSLDFGDYDNDGDLDLLVSGLNQTDSSLKTVAKLYKYQGHDFFEEVVIGLDGFDRGFIEWGDLDNDGDLDIISGVGLYRNEGNDIFISMNTVITGYHFAAGRIVDLDGDGDLDIFAGIENGNPEVFRNNGNFNFSEVLLPAIPVINNPLNGDVFTINQDMKPLSSAAYYGTSEIGDYDNDGDQDLLWMSSNATVIYRNDGNFNFTIPSNIDLPILRTGSGKFGDFDNDGDLDIFLTGGNSYNDWESGLYINEGNDVFVKYPFYFRSEEIISYASVECGDIDNDGDLDLIVVGEMPIDNWVTRIFINNTIEANTIPEAPTALLSSRNNFNLSLDWSESFDLQTRQSGLTYNLAVGTTPGGYDVVSPMSDMSTGLRKIVSAGNTGSNTNFILQNLKSGRYFWSVQSLDNNFAGSQFSISDSFRVPVFISGITIGSGNINPVYIDSTLISIQLSDSLNGTVGISVDRYDILPGGELPNNLQNPAPISWVISITEGNIQGSYSLIFNLNDFTMFDDYSKIHLLFRNSENDLWIDLGTPSDLSGGNTAVKWNNLTAFGEYTICGGLDEPLPVELLTFNAVLIEASNDVNLSWTTATELNNSGFEVERSENNTNWEKIGFVNGSGTSTEVREYSYVDHLERKSTKLKYRLKQIDFDGTSTYYNAVEIGFVPSEFVLNQNYPNPFNPSTSISFELPVSAEVKLTVYDILGNEITTLIDEFREAGYYKTNFSSNSDQLATGIYIYRLTAKTGNINFTKTMKMLLIK